MLDCGAEELLSELSVLLQIPEHDGVLYQGSRMVDCWVNFCWVIRERGSLSKHRCSCDGVSMLQKMKSAGKVNTKFEHLFCLSRYPTPCLEDLLNQVEPIPTPSVPRFPQLTSKTDCADLSGTGLPLCKPESVGRNPILKAQCNHTSFHRINGICQKS